MDTSQSNDFNVFKFLKIERKETISSQFIVSLMNESRAYLKNFLEIIGYVDYIDIYKCSIEAEVLLRHRKTKKEYGRADIWIGYEENGISKRIIIENKLFAREQYNQIHKYREYLNEDNRQGLLFYLTLEEKPASSFSAKDSRQEMHTSNDAAKGYQTISYQNHVIKWLGNIENSSKPELSSLINQYKNILEEFCFIHKKILEGENIVNIPNTRKSEFNAGLELLFWNVLEKEIELKAIEANKTVVIDSRRKFNYDKIFKHQKGQSFGNRYGLISGHLRICINPANKRTSHILISNGSFNSESSNWTVFDNRNYVFDSINLKDLEDKKMTEEKASYFAVMFINLY